MSHQLWFRNTALTGHLKIGKHCLLPKLLLKSRIFETIKNKSQLSVLFYLFIFTGEELRYDYGLLMQNGDEIQKLREQKVI